MSPLFDDHAKAYYSEWYKKTDLINIEDEVYKSPKETV